ncbi:hypothetical protein M0802_009808 [Mischocyttarus mexicanus]|nr:hypothetical protein M0802_009808 [Mischocyttarus mexicanus]
MSNEDTQWWNISRVVKKEEAGNCNCSTDGLFRLFLAARYNYGRTYSNSIRIPDGAVVPPLVLAIVLCVAKNRRKQGRTPTTPPPPPPPTTTTTHKIKSNEPRLGLARVGIDSIFGALVKPIASEKPLMPLWVLMERSFRPVNKAAVEETINYDYQLKVRRGTSANEPPPPPPPLLPPPLPLPPPSSSRKKSSVGRTHMKDMTYGLEPLSYLVKTITNIHQY